MQVIDAYDTIYYRPVPCVMNEIEMTKLRIEVVGLKVNVEIRQSPFQFFCISELIACLILKLYFELLNIIKCIH